MPEQPDPLQVFVVWASLGVLALLLISMAYGALRSHLRPKSTPEAPPAPETPPVVMATKSTPAPAKQGVAEQGQAPPQEVGQGVATPGNAGNEELPGNALAPAEVRAIIRHERAVEAAVALITSGKVGQVEAIEIIFACKRSGRPESLYARARAAVLERLDERPQFRQVDGTVAPADYPVSGGPGR